MTSTLYNLDVPDELAELDLKDAESKEIAKACYKAWRGATKEESERPGSYYILYETACRITKSYADRLVDVFKEKQTFNMSEGDELNAGLFFSAIINQSSKREIISNLETKMYYLANRLPAGKIFVNYGNSGPFMGVEAKGMVINCGETDSSVGEGASGTVINFGKAGNKMGEWSTGMVVNCGEAGDNMCDNAEGIVIALKNPKIFGQTIDDTLMHELALDEDNCKGIPKIIKYFDNLKAVLDEGKTDCKVLSKFPNGRKIRDDVKNILKARGYLA